MPGKSVEKLLRKLNSRKYRWQLGMFVAEGEKVVNELLASGLNAVHLFSANAKTLPEKSLHIISEKKLQELSKLESGGGVIGIFNFPEYKSAKEDSFTVVLDRINDPGNLGTIIRTCDWFGIHKVYCNKGSTDVFNSKSIQSSMGSIARVEVVYAEDNLILETLKYHEILVADLDGGNLFSYKPTKSKIALVMGSESHGPSAFWKEKAKAITIPKHPDSKTESLNVAQAAAIMVSHLQQPD